MHQTGPTIHHFVAILPMYAHIYSKLVYVGYLSNALWDLWDQGLLIGYTVVITVQCRYNVVNFFTKISEHPQKCDMAFIEPMHRNKPNITYLLHKYSQNTPHSLPVTVRYGVDWAFDNYSAPVSTIISAIYYCIGLHYDGTPPGFIAVREMSGRNKISQGQGNVREFYRVSGKFWHLAKLMKNVMEFQTMSGKMTILDNMTLQSPRILTN